MSDPTRILGRSARLVVVGLAAAVLFAAMAAPVVAAPLALTADFAGETVSVIDTATNAVLGKPIPVGKRPGSIAITPDGRRALVVNEVGDSVSVIDLASRKPIGEAIAVGDNPTSVAIAPGGRLAYVAVEGSDRVVEIDTLSATIVASAGGVPSPYGIAVAPGGASVWVTSSSGNSVSVLDSRTLASVGAPIPVGADPVTVAFTPDARTAYVADYEAGTVSAIDTATRAVTALPAGKYPWGLGITPDGRKLFVANSGDDTVEVIATATGSVVDEFPVGEEPYEFGIAPNGKVAYLGELASGDVLAIDTATDKPIGAPIALPGKEPWQVTVEPDQSPTAAFTAPSAVAGSPVGFDGSASSDPDGTVASWEWLFGDGGSATGRTATGRTATHTYGSAGTFGASLGVLDDEGCGEAEVFTGRTALCGGGASRVAHQVAVSAPPAAPSPPLAPPPNQLRFGRLVHDRRNGTARLLVHLPAAGSILLTGPKVHLVRRKIAAPGTLSLTIHARVELNRRLKKTLRARVGLRITFTPVGGTPATRSHSVVLQRAPRKKR